MGRRHQNEGNVVVRITRLRAIVQATMAAMALAAVPAAATGDGGSRTTLLSPRLTISAGGAAAPRVALTLDACSGKVDGRILDALVANRVPATIFVTARWLRINAAAAAVFTAHRDLFEIENHGGEHHAAVFDRPTVDGVPTVGSPDALAREIDSGAAALTSLGIRPRWYRGATALYSRAAIPLIEAAGYLVAGFSLNADQGASLPARTVARRIAAARDGDVIIAHINQPSRSAGAGVVEGILALREKGYRFVRLSDVGSGGKAAPQN